MKLLRRIRLFRRLPTLPIRWQPKKQHPFIPDELQRGCSLLRDDFTFLEETLMPVYQELDNKSLEMQNRFRFYQVALIAGGVISSALTIFLIVFINHVQIATLIGAVEALVAGGLALLARVTYESDAQKLYSTNRLAAEILRSEYFLFLGRLGSYADDQKRKRNLQLRLVTVEKIARGERE